MAFILPTISMFAPVDIITCTILWDQADYTSLVCQTSYLVRRQVNVLSQRSKFAVGTFQTDHLTMVTKLNSVAQGGKHSLGCN